ncbi:MAG: HAMP domain-containing histidine kinase [Clostridia bacterium]|nr:HAMP domain-containing histidine kinase [Clostridia bacterium]
MSRISVKLRVTLWYLIIMIIMSSVVLVAMTSISEEMVSRDASERITRTVRDMSRRFHIPGDDLRFAPPGFKLYEQGVHMVVYDNELNLIAGQIPFGIEEEFELENDKLRKENINGNQYYIYDSEIKLRGGDSLWLRGIMSVTDAGYAVKSALKNNVILTIILIFAAAAGGYFIIKRAFVPVSKISKTAKEIADSSDLSRRINIGEGKDEIFALANTFDEMLDKIEQSFEREKQFTQDASHELRTPVAVILSECEYMEECAKTDEEFKESAASVKKQAEKMSKLISELLMISRMDKNTLKTNFEETDISELLAFVCDEQEEIRTEDILLERNIMPCVTAKADRFLLARLFINLISNAYQYSESGGTIKVTLKEGIDRIVFEVSDNGIGISEEDLPKIWERFYQADASRTAKENGSMGLGLSMVKWIAECHGGRVSAKSELGCGSTFIFWLPKN